MKKTFCYSIDFMHLINKKYLTRVDMTNVEIQQKYISNERED